MSYFIGQEIRSYGTFTDAAGVATDPGTVRFAVATPGGALQYIGSYVNSTAYGSVVRQNTGTYYADLILTAGGYWQRAWEGTGALNASLYDRIFVRYRESNT